MKPDSTVSRSDFALLAPWYAAEGLGGLANNLFIMGSIFYVRNTLHRPNRDCLLVTATWGCFYVVFSMLSGKLTDRLGSRRLVIGASFCGCLAGLVGLSAIAVPQLWVVLVCLSLFNLTNTPMWPAIESAVTRAPARASLSTRIAVYNLTWSSSNAIATTVSGLINALNPRAIFLSSAAVCLLASLLVRFFTPVQMWTVEPAKDHTERAEQQTVNPQRARTLLQMAWLANPLSYFATFVLIALIPQLLASTGNHSAAWSGLWTFMRVPAFILCSLWTGWHYRTRYMLGAFVLLAASFLLMLLSTDLPMLVAGQIGFGVSAAFIYSGSLYYAMHVSAGAGGHAGIHEAMIGVGMMSGPMVGVLASLAGAGVPAIAVWVTSVLAVGLVALLVLARKANRPAVSQHRTGDSAL